MMKEGADNHDNHDNNHNNHNNDNEEDMETINTPPLWNVYIMKNGIVITLLYHVVIKYLDVEYVMIKKICIY